MILLPAITPVKKNRHIRRGHAIVLTLLILLVTAAVAFGVLSIGRHARVKEMTHFSAQAGAESGASWIARSLNTVAMNNNAMARLIVQAGIIDGLPTAIGLYRNDLKAINVVLKHIQVKDLPRDWQAIDKGNPIAMGFDRFIRSNTYELNATINTEKYLKQQLKDNDITAITHVLPDPQSNQLGIIWQAINALDEINQTILENIEVQTQLSVLRGSILDTTARQTEASAMMLPTSQLMIPWKHGRFEDFAPIILEDHQFQLTNGYLEYAANPNIDQLRLLTTLVPEKIKVPRNKAGQCPLSKIRAYISMQNTSQNRQRKDMSSPELEKITQPAARDLAVLNTIGTLLYRLKNQRIIKHIDTISKHHVSQLWPDDKAQVQPIHDSQWITDSQKIFEIMDKNPQSIREIAFVTMQMKSAFAPADPKFRTDDSWVILDQKNDMALNVEYFTFSKSMDPRSWDKLGIEQIHPRMWRESWTYPANSDRTINLKPLPANEKTKHPKQPVYRVDDYLLIGINVGKDLNLASPYNFASGMTKPAPILYVNDAAKSSDQIHRTVVALNHVRALPWSTPVAPTETASPMIAPYDLLVENQDNNSLWFQGWAGRAIPNDSPSLSGIQTTDALQPLVSEKLFDSVLTELKTRNAQAKQEESQVP